MGRRYSTVTRGKAFTAGDFALGVLASLLVHLCLLMSYVALATLAGPKVGIMLPPGFVPQEYAGPEPFDPTLAFAIYVVLPLLVNAGAFLALRRRRPGIAWGMFATPVMVLFVILSLQLYSARYGHGS